MSVLSTTNRKSYSGDAVTTSFATNPVVFFDSSDLTVSVISALGVATTLVENTDYAVTGGDGTTGTVNLAGGSAPYGAPAAGTTLLILRVVPLTQPADLVNNDGSDAEVQERAYDRLTMMVQQLNEVDSRAIKLPASETGTSAQTELPVDRASKFLAFDASKNIIASSGPAGDNVPVSTFMATVLDDATAADARTTLGAASSATVSALDAENVKLTGAQTIAGVKTFTSAPALPAGMLTGYLHSMTISNNVADVTNDMDIAAGVCRDSTDAVSMVLAASITKRLDAAWAVGTNQGGLDTGSIANDTYHIHVIRRPDTGVVDVLFSVSPTAPTLPANYTQFRRIGSFIRSGGSIIRAVQNGDRFMFTGGGTLDVNVTNPGTSAVTRTLSVPTDIVVEAIVSVTLDAVTNSGVTWLLTSLDQDDVAESATNRTIGTADNDGNDTQISGMAQVKTNTSAQIRSRTSVSGASDSYRLSTLGYIDNRGRT